MFEYVEGRPVGVCGRTFSLCMAMTQLSRTVTGDPRVQGQGHAIVQNQVNYWQKSKILFKKINNTQHFLYVSVCAKGSFNMSIYLARTCWPILLVFNVHLLLSL